MTAADDLPDLTAGQLAGSAVVDLVEAVGPGFERSVQRVLILGNDQHSDTGYATNASLRRSSDGSASYSCERWVRLRFTPPFGAIANVRFWLADYQPSDGWSLQWGVTDSYRQPSLTASDIATLPVPTVDPGVTNLGVDFTAGDQMQYSDWLVLQARWIGDTRSMQADPVNFTFEWTES